MIGPSDERARPPAGDGFTDAVTFSFGDPRARVYGLVRLGLSGDGDGRTGSALAVLFDDREPLGALARGGVPVVPGTDWEAIGIAGVRAAVEAPLERWTVAMAGSDAPGELDLAFEALGPPAAVEEDHPVARTGGMAGYEQPCRVTGTVTIRGDERRVDCLGQRGRAWGRPDWSALESARSISAWLGDDLAITISALRARGYEGHAEDVVWAAIIGSERAEEVDEPRISTTYDGDRHQRRAGLELWVAEDDGYPRRAAGEIVCGSTLELGQLALDAAFFRWHMDGREGVGRYDVLRRA